MSTGYDLIVNGRSVRVESDGDTPLLSVLRDELGLRGSRFGCGTEQCGACMVLIDGKPEYSCAREVATVAGRRITTVEGLAQNGALHPVQQAFLERAGRPVRLLPVGHPGLRRRVARARPQARPRRHRRGARSASLPLRHAQPRDPRRRTRRSGGNDGMIANTLPQSLIDNPILSQWIGFEDKDRVRVGSGKVEIGQGILTALSQIAAEELDIRFEQVRLVSGQTDISPGEGFTSGSYSIAVGGASIRLVCAEVRALFLDRAAEKLGCKAGELSVEAGRILRAGRDTGHDYWSLAGEVALDRRASGTAPVKRPSSYRIVGRNVPRVDLPAKVAGAAFIHDIVPDGVVHARVLRRPWRGAHLAALDMEAVRRTAKAPIDDLHEGDFVAFTAASEIAVMRAAEAARTLARWDGGTPAPDDIGEPDWLKAQPSRDRIVESAASGRSGDGKNGGRVVEALYSRPFLTYGSIGPSCGLAEFKDDALKVWSHTQGPAVLRDWLARALGLTAAQVTVFHRQGAGAYGHNTADDAAFDAAFIAMRMPGRTVRVQWSREDEFIGAPISTAMAIGLRAVLDAQYQPGRLDDRALERAACPASGHERQRQLHRRRSAARSAAAERAQRRAGRARRRRHAQRLSDLRPAAPPADPPPAADPAAAHLVAARARRLGQCVRDRVVHRRTR